MNNPSMKTLLTEWRKLINENHPPVTSASEIFMDMMRHGGPDHFVAIAHEKPGMKCTDFMHYEHALRAYIDTIAPHLHTMPNNVWNQVCELLREVV